MPTALLCLVFWFSTPNPSQACAWQGYVVAFAQTSAEVYDYNRARAWLELGLFFAPASPRLLTERGKVALLAYEWDAALIDFNRALALAPDEAEAYFQRGILHYSRSEREAALSDFSTYLALTPTGVQAALARRYQASIQLELQALTPQPP